MSSVGPSLQRASRARARRIGALAGLAPAGVILGWHIGTGGPFTPGLIEIAAACVLAGWLIGPRATGRIRDDIVATVGFFVVGYLIETSATIALSTVEDLRVGASTDPVSVIRDGAMLWLGRFAYMPVFGVFLSPAALTWILAVRFLRAHTSQAAD